MSNEHELLKQEWPRERLKLLGAANLGDEELLALVIRTGGDGLSVLPFCRRLLRRQSLVELATVQLPEWLAIKGVDLAKAAALVAAFELAERITARRQVAKVSITSPSAAAQRFDSIREKRREYLCALYLNARHEIVHQEVISIGTVDRSLIHPRELFAPALAHRASAVIIAHNHPSGNTEPSEEDIAVTRSLAKAARLLQLSLLDHLIVTATAELSLREWGVQELQAVDSS